MGPLAAGGVAATCVPFVAVALPKGCSGRLSSAAAGGGVAMGSWPEVSGFLIMLFAWASRSIEACSLTAST